MSDHYVNLKVWCRLNNWLFDPDILASNKKVDPFLLICNNAPEHSTPGIWYDRSGYDTIGLDILILYVSSQQISSN
jgi:hypothetical protein